MIINDTMSYSIYQNISHPFFLYFLVFLDTILSTLQSNANVLIPVDSSARILELAYLLDHHWHLQRLHYPLLFLSHQSTKTIQYAKSMLEWMGDAITRAFSQNRENPFDFR